MRIAFGSDHAGASLKAELLAYAQELGHEVSDFGGGEDGPVDYPVYAFAVAKAVARGEYDRGILICGTGLGMSIAANKVRGVRAALCHECYTARMSREHNDANILCLGQRVLGPGLAREVLRVFLSTPFSQGASHVRRLAMISAEEGAALR
jgi:ribose 5-phosphate isomerase B